MDRSERKRRGSARPALRWGTILSALLGLTFLAAPPAPGAPERKPPEDAEIHDLHVENRTNEVLTSFTLHGAFTEEIREQIETGLPVTFNHYVEIKKRRIAWFDDTLVKKVISSTVAYDTLTRQYRLSRSVDGDVVETTVSDKASEMESFMAGVERVRLCDLSDLPGERPLYMRVKSRVQKRFVLFFIPWDFETSWARIGIPLSVDALPAAEPPGP